MAKTPARNGGAPSVSLRPQARPTGAKGTRGSAAAPGLRSQLEEQRGDAPLRQKRMMKGGPVKKGKK